MWLVFLFLILILLGIVFFRIEIVLKKIVLNKNTQDFKLNINFMFFGFIKVFCVHLDKEGIKFFNKKILYENLMSKEKFEHLKLDIEKVGFKETLQIIKELKLKINTAKFSLRLGLGEIFLTNILVVIVSSLISVLYGIKGIEVKLKNINYKVLPDFNKVSLLFEGRFCLSFKGFEVIKLFFKNYYGKKKHLDKVIQKSIGIES